MKRALLVLWLPLISSACLVPDKGGDPVDDTTADSSPDSGRDSGRDSAPDSTIDSGEETGAPSDADGDGFLSPEDCDDSEAAVFPGAPERCDGLANDCDSAGTWTGAEEAGTASFEPATGGFVDYTTLLSGAVVLSESGTLRLCSGTWTVNLSVEADALSILGFPVTGEVVLSGGGLGRVIDLDAGALGVSGLRLTDGAASSGGCLRVGPEAEVSLSEVSVEGCEATEDGGGVSADGGATLTLSGCSIRDNRAGSWGGGLNVDTGATATLTDTSILGNEAGYGAGGVSADGSLAMAGGEISGNQSYALAGGASTSGGMTLTGVDVRGNTTEGFGGGILARGGELVANDSEISENKAVLGGGVHVIYGALVTLTDTTLDANHVVGDIDDIEAAGAAMFINESVLTSLNRVTVTNNISDNEYGGIAVALVTLEITDSLIAGNTANATAGGLKLFGYDDGLPMVTITGTTISDNLAGSAGGILQSGNATLSVTDSEISGNSSGVGGALVITDGEATFTNVAFLGNAASREGGAIYGARGAGLTILEDCVVSGNSADGDGGGIYATYATVTSTDFSDNTPNDVCNYATGSCSDVGTGASFTCDASGCTP